MSVLQRWKLPSGKKIKTARYQRRWILRLFEWTILLVLILLLKGIFLGRIERLQVEAERLAFQGVLNSLKAATTFASIGRFEAEGMEVGGNPMALLEQVPVNYGGLLMEAQSCGLEQGHWYYDRRREVLIYYLRVYHRNPSALGKGPVRQFRLDRETSVGAFGYRWVLRAVEA